MQDCHRPAHARGVNSKEASDERACRVALPPCAHVWPYAVVLQDVRKPIEQRLDLLDDHLDRHAVDLAVFGRQAKLALQGRRPPPRA